MTYPSRNSRISAGLGNSSSFTSSASASSSSMISLHKSMHSSQMYTPGPAISFLTCFWLFPQNEHLSRSPPSPMRATSSPSSGGPGRGPIGSRGDPETIQRHRGSRVSGNLEGVGVSAPCGGAALAAAQHLVDQTVLHRLLSGEDLVALDVLLDLLGAPVRVEGHRLLQPVAHAEDLV